MIARPTLTVPSGNLQASHADPSCHLRRCRCDLGDHRTHHPRGRDVDARPRDARSCRACVLVRCRQGGVRRRRRRRHSRHLLSARQPGGRRRACLQRGLYDRCRGDRARGGACDGPALDRARAGARLSRDAVQLRCQQQCPRGPAVAVAWGSRSSAACRGRLRIRPRASSMRW